MEEVQACTESLKKWLGSVQSSRGNSQMVKVAAISSPYYFGDVPKSEGGKDIKTSTAAISYWSMYSHHRTADLQSTILKELFRFVELAPLLCILDDFLEPFDLFCQSNEVKSDPIDQSKEEVAVGAAEVPTTTKHNNQLDEAEYLQGLELYGLLKCRLLDLQHRWKSVLDQVLPHEWRDFVEVHRSLIIKELQGLVEKMHSILQERFNGDGYIPRFIRLCQSLELSEKENDAMVYIFLQNGGVLFSRLYNRFSVMKESMNSGISGNRSNSMALGTALFAGMNGKEMYEFFSENRMHLKQELFTSEDEFSSLLTSSFLQMSPTVTKACCGGILSAEETYKIDKTVLADILLAEDKAAAAVVGREDTGKQDGKEGSTEDKKEDNIGDEVQIEEAAENEELELEEILRACNDIQQTVNVPRTDDDDTQGYGNDLEYLEDNFELIETLVKARKTESSDDVLILRSDQRRPEAVGREMKAKARSLKAKIAKKMEATKAAGDWLPRLERLAELRKLNQFEKNVLLTLTGCIVSRNLRNSGGNDSVFSRHNFTSIGMLIGLFCEGLEEQIKARVYFYQNSVLIREGLVHVSDPPLLSRGNFLDSGVELDRRLLDYIVGLDTEINELIDGSDLYSPDTELSDVALPSAQRELILNAFDSFHKFKKTCKELKLATRGSSKGLCMLFYGPSGTGKTMTANAVAKHLNKKILLVTVSLLNESQITKDLLRFIFREAKIHNAIIFFDECEPIFESRDNRPNHVLALMLTEIEQYDDIIILATNRHQDLDEAMHRRIQVALPFSIPDYTLRKKIWQTHVPDQLLADAHVVDWDTLAQSYELTGGLIRNAVLSAVSLASKDTPGTEVIRLCNNNLHNGAKLQLRGLLEMVDFERRVIPTFGLDEVLLEPSIKNTVNAIINTGKTHKFITTQWGFSNTGSNNENVAHAGGVVCLLSGSAGMGKTAVAHCIAYELGQPIKEANCSELLSHTVTLNPRASKGIATFFRDAQRANAIVVLDGAEFVFGSVSGVAGVIGCETYSLAYQIERYPGMVILTTRQDVGLLDISRVPHLRYVIPLRQPSVGLREKLWEKLLPKKVPKAREGICFKTLAERFSINGGQIAAIICSAAEKAVSSVTPGAGDQTVVVTTELLCDSAEDYLSVQESGRSRHLEALFQ